VPRIEALERAIMDVPRETILDGILLERIEAIELRLTKLNEYFTAGYLPPRV
jgi:hypothetical protein